MGLVSDAGVHAMIDHLFGMISLAKASGIRKIFLHAFTDGRDTGPYTGKKFIQEIEAFFENEGVGEVASLIGRYWSMDRDNRWDRVKKAYDALVGREIVNTFSSAVDAIEHHYKNPETESTQGDEFCPPSIIVDENREPKATISDKDSVIFFNFRGDRHRN